MNPTSVDNKKEVPEAIAIDVTAPTDSKKEVLLESTQVVSGEKPFFKRPSQRSQIIHVVVMTLLTAYFIWMTIKGSSKNGYIPATLIYIFIALRTMAKYVNITRTFYNPLGKAYDATIAKVIGAIPEKIRLPLLALVWFVALIVVAVVSPVTEVGNVVQRLQSALGVFVFLGLLYVTSSDRKSIPFRTVVVGMVLNYIIALFVIKTQAGVVVFSNFSTLIKNFLNFSEYGLEFLFGKGLAHTYFVINVFPAIVFFCSFISVVYYFGGMQYIVQKMAWLMVRLMDTSGAESVVAVASPFVGQGESALLVKPFVEFMTMSELHSTMTSGFSTIAGSVLLAYQAYIGDLTPILTACVMSVPTSLLVSKMRLPEKENSLTRGEVKIPETEEKEANFLHAAGNGAAVGVNLILLIGGSLLSIMALYACADFIVGFLFQMVDGYDTFNPSPDGKPVWVTIQLILSFPFYVVAWLVGIPKDDCRKAGEFMSMKMVVNEFAAYAGLNAYAIGGVGFDGVYKGPTGKFEVRTIKLLAFALCGFANLSSIGIQIGCLGAMAPTRSRDLAKLAFSAMLTGTISTWLCAAVAGTLL
ncbi:hypothetical protein HK099_002926 [Clydaea vesicula]|uniref:Uncharacterized protein n=1 Tax=Clydaea vesicula TaxID=447962 RepID=A0AAD5Y3Q9_9FUNG|nr:hypothetical protein HK099_002926 [Clydaea vesicula]KAJ3395704.1 hypothetical protein HDU92_005170 [Lobulomyces angularis]